MNNPKAQKAKPPRTATTKTQGTHNRFKVCITSTGFVPIYFKGGNTIEYPTLTMSRFYDLLLHDGYSSQLITPKSALTFKWANTNKDYFVVDLTITPGFGKDAPGDYRAAVRAVCKEALSDYSDGMLHEGSIHFVIAAVIYAVRGVARAYGFIK